MSDPDTDTDGNHALFSGKDDFPPIHPFPDSPMHSTGIRG
jgi:hypothetical protein